MGRRRKEENMGARILLLLLAVTVAAPACSAGKLDLDPPSYEKPAIAAGLSAVAPGAGWFYAASQPDGTWKDAAHGAGYLAAITGLALILRNMIRRGQDIEAPAATLAGAMLAIRFDDIVTAAKRQAPRRP
jgi:hypothetical protein